MSDIITEKENTLVIQCYDRLQEDLINGLFAPGQKLKIEALSKYCDVGHSPIREALSRLVSSGLVEAHDNKGFRVTRIWEADIRDLYDTFFQVEILALEQAIERGNDVWETSIVAALYHLALVETKQEPVLYHVWSARNYAFHVALISGCNSPRLLQVRADLYRQFDRYCRIAFNLSKMALVPNHEEHKKLAEVVIQRNKKEARALMRHHVFGALEDVIQTLKQNNMI